jgi:rhodanese-related sulfurtransferase
MTLAKIDVQTLKRLEPLGSLSEERLAELAELCYVESVSKNLDPFRTRSIAGQTVYLVRGEIALTYPGGASIILVGASEEARHPLGRRGAAFASAKTITDVELVRIDDDLLDIMVTWDQLASTDAAHRTKGEPPEGPTLAKWSIMSGMFSVSNLKYGAFAQLPPAHIEGLLDRFQRIEVKAGEVIIREGAEGDYYYVIESGKARVERLIGGVSMLLAELKSGDAFGEEALVSEAKRNATVTMRAAGALLRLDKKDFIELLREPLLHRVSMEEAQQKVLAGAQWIDVRYPSEFQYDKLSGAINIPLSEIRNAFGLLDKDREYVVYCQSERRSSAATFLLSQRGYRAYLLQGGLWGTGGERRGA